MSGDQEILDVQILAVLKDAVGESIIKIIKVYLDEFPHIIMQLRAAISQQDFTTVGRLAHSLKSSSANLGAIRLAKLAQHLEQEISEGETEVGGIEQQIAKLVDNFDQVRPMLNEYLNQ